MHLQQYPKPLPDLLAASVEAAVMNTRVRYLYWIQDRPKAGLVWWEGDNLFTCRMAEEEIGEAA